MDEAGRVGLLLDRVEIEELTARYNRTFDDMDVEGWSATFTADGTMSLGGREWSGRQALQRLMDKIGFGMVHLTTNSIVELRGDEATQRCSLVLVRRTLDRRPVQLLTTGRYVDDLVRTDAGWRFRRRDGTMDNDLSPKIFDH